MICSVNALTRNENRTLGCLPTTIPGGPVMTN
jgi:hypothetical protein